MNIDSILSEYRECWKFGFLKSSGSVCCWELCLFEADDTNCDAELN